MLAQERNATAVRLDDGDIHCSLAVAMFIGFNWMYFQQSATFSHSA